MAEEEYVEDEEENVERADTSTELILAITKPKVAADHERFISRDLTVSNIPPKEADKVLALARRHISLILDFNFLGINDMASIYDSELKAMLGLNRSIDGFERKQQTTVTSRKEVFGEDKTKKKLGV